MEKSWGTTLLVILLGTVIISSTQARCPEPGYYELENTYITKESEDHITYSCYQGYTLVGHEENFCMGGDYWAFEPPLCQIMSCPPLEPVLDGKFYPDEITTHGTTVRFECLYATELYGAEEIKCVGDQWIPAPPKCVVEECELDMTGRHLQLVLGSLEVGDILEVKCSEPGLTMVGKSLINCLRHRQWDREPPYCVDTNCEIDLSAGHLREVYGGRKVGEDLKLECSEPGLTMVGESLISCLRHKQWDREPPYCVGRGVKPPQCTDVVVTSDTVAVAAREDSCYAFINTYMKFYDAKSTCERNNGYLVSIPDRESNEWLVSTLTALAGDWRGANAWLGLKWVSRSLRWQWLRQDGGWTPLGTDSYDNRQSYTLGHPGYCQFLSLDSRSSGRWKQEYCIRFSKKHKVICQYPIDP